MCSAAKAFGGVGLATGRDALHAGHVVVGCLRLSCGQAEFRIAHDLGAGRSSWEAIKLTGIVTREIGKPYPEALGEVQEIVDTCDFFLGEGRRLGVALHHRGARAQGRLAAAVAGPAALVGGGADGGRTGDPGRRRPSGPDHGPR